MKILFLDDDDDRHKEFLKHLGAAPVVVKPVKTVAEAVAALDRETFELIFLDHDLDGKVMVESGPGTGLEVARHLMSTPNKSAQVVVHSLNDKGARAMLDVLGPKAVWVPFHQIYTILNAVKLRTR